METRHDQMREHCIAFHEKHPEVWDLLVQFSHEMRSRGFQRYSIRAVFERIRWEKDAGGDGVNQFKINSNHQAFYARRFMRMYPEFEGFYKTREQKSKQTVASDFPELTPQDYEYTNDRYFT